MFWVEEGGKIEEDDGKGMPVLNDDACKIFFVFLIVDWLNAGIKDEWMRMEMRN